MEREVIEHNKVRSVILDSGYTYQEVVKSDEGDEFFSMVKESDYSFLYVNFAMQEKVGAFYVESDSLFIDPFLGLVGEDEEFRIDDDYSERFIRMFKDANGGVGIEIHLLPGEYDATIELKNIMLDLRSQADGGKLDTKKRLSTFFDELIKVYELIPDDSDKKLTNKMVDGNIK